MKRLGDFPVVRKGQGGPSVLAADEPFREAAVCDGTLSDMLAAQSDGGPVLVIDSDVSLTPGIEALPLEDVLLEAKVPLVWPTFSKVTGMAVSWGARLLWRTEDPKDTVVVPRLVGAHHPNQTPESAFRAGYATLRAASLPDGKAAQSRLALQASLGADTLNGAWWILGALAALSGEMDGDAAWGADAPLLSSQTAIVRTIRARAQLTRDRTGLPVRALDRRQSETIKKMLPRRVPPEVWTDYARFLDGLGRDGRRLAGHVRRAGETVWNGRL